MRQPTSFKEQLQSRQQAVSRIPRGQGGTVLPATRSSDTSVPASDGDLSETVAAAGPSGSDLAVLHNNPTFEAAPLAALHPHPHHRQLQRYLQQPHHHHPHVQQHPRRRWRCRTRSNICQTGERSPRPRTSSASLVLVACIVLVSINHACAVVRMQLAHDVAVHPGGPWSPSPGLLLNPAAGGGGEQVHGLVHHRAMLRMVTCSHGATNPFPSSTASSWGPLAAAAQGGLSVS